MSQRRCIIEKASAWNQSASGSENTNADVITQTRDKVFWKVRRIYTEEVITKLFFTQAQKRRFILKLLIADKKKKERKEINRDERNVKFKLEIQDDKWQQFTPSQSRWHFAMKKKKRWWTHCHRDPSSRGEKKRYYSTEVTLTKHRNSNSNSQVGIIRQSLGLNRQGTLNATVCSLSRAVVRWVFLMIRNSFNLYQLFSQSFILILEEGGKNIRRVSGPLL